MILCALYVFNDNSLYAHLVFVAWGAPDSPALPSHSHKNIHVLFLWGLGAGSGGHGSLLFYVQRQHLHSTRVYSYAKFSSGLVRAERRQVEVVTLALFVLFFWGNRTWSHMFALKKKPDRQRTCHFNLKEFLFWLPSPHTCLLWVCCLSCLWQTDYLLQSCCLTCTVHAGPFANLQHNNCLINVRFLHLDRYWWHFSCLPNTLCLYRHTLLSFPGP